MRLATDGRKVSAAALTAVCVAALFVALAPFSILGCRGTEKPARPRRLGPVSAADREAKRLLARYNLHPAGTAQEGSMTIEGGLYGFVNDASRDVGLDLARYEGLSLPTLEYVLAERSQGDTTVSATFVRRGRDIVGACMNLHGYSGGGVSLRDRFQLMPAHLRPDNLDFTAVTSIHLWMDSYGVPRPRERTVKDQPTIKRLLTLLRGAKRERTHWMGSGDREDYNIGLQYRTGEQVAVRLATYKDLGETVFTYDPQLFAPWQYIPPEELKASIGRLLRDSQSSPIR